MTPTAVGHRGKIWESWRLVTPSCVMLPAKLHRSQSNPRRRQTIDVNVRDADSLAVPFRGGRISPAVTGIRVRSTPGSTDNQLTATEFEFASQRSVSSGCRSEKPGPQ